MVRALLSRLKGCAPDVSALKTSAASARYARSRVARAELSSSTAPRRVARSSTTSESVLPPCAPQAKLHTHVRTKTRGPTLPSSSAPWFHSAAEESAGTPRTGTVSGVPASTNSNTGTVADRLSASGSAPGAAMPALSVSALSRGPRARRSALQAASASSATAARTRAGSITGPRRPRWWRAPNPSLRARAR